MTWVLKSYPNLTQFASECQLLPLFLLRSRHLLHSLHRLLLCLPRKLRIRQHLLHQVLRVRDLHVGDVTGYVSDRLKIRHDEADVRGNV